MHWMVEHITSDSPKSCLETRRHELTMFCCTMMSKVKVYLCPAVKSLIEIEKREIVAANRTRDLIPVCLHVIFAKAYNSHNPSQPKASRFSLHTTPCVLMSSLHKKKSSDSISAFFTSSTAAGVWNSPWVTIESAKKARPCLLAQIISIIPQLFTAVTIIISDVYTVEA